MILTVFDSNRDLILRILIEGMNWIQFWKIDKTGVVNWKPLYVLILMTRLSPKTVKTVRMVDSNSSSSIKPSIDTVIVRGLVKVDPHQRSMIPLQFDLNSSLNISHFSRLWFQSSRKNRKSINYIIIEKSRIFSNWK